MLSELEKHEVLIIGGGPAGMSAAITCAELGIDAILLEREAELGGQLLWTYNAIDNYPPFRAENGRELRDHFLQRLAAAGVNYRTNSRVVKADLQEKTFTLENGDLIAARSIILATGISRRRLHVPGEAEFRGKGILESGIKDKEKVRGKTVVIVGGGDAAVENACILSEVAKRVFVVHRRDRFTAQEQFVTRARGRANVEFLFNSRLAAVLGDERVRAVAVDDLASGQRTIIAADAVLIRIGVTPVTALFRGQICFDDNGFIVSDRESGLNLPGVYAAGDAAHPSDLNLVVATQSGIRCAERTKI